MNHTYVIPDTFLIARSDHPLRSPFFIMHDKKQIKKTVLEKLFLDAHKIFRGRVRDLGKLDMDTTASDADAMRVMLVGLISAKRQIRRERGD